MGTVVLDSFNGVPLGAPLTLVTADGSFTPQSVATAYGTLSVTGFTPVTGADGSVIGGSFRSEEHTSELQSLMRISYAVFCLQKKINKSQVDKIINQKHAKTMTKTSQHT